MLENDKYTGRVGKFVRELEDCLTLPKGAFVERVSIDYSTLRDPDLPYKAEVTIQRLSDRSDGPRFVFAWGKTPEKALENIRMQLSKEWPKKYSSVEDTIKKVRKTKTRSGSWINIPSVTIRPLSTGRFLCTFDILGDSPVTGSGVTLEEAVWGAWYAFERRYDISPSVPQAMSRYDSMRRSRFWLHRNGDGDYYWSRNVTGAYEFSENEYLYWQHDPEALFDLLPVSKFCPRIIGTIEWTEKP